MKIGIDCRLWSESGVGRYTRNLVSQLQIIDKINHYTLFVLPKDCKQVKFEIRNSKFEIRIADIRWHTLKEQLKFPQILNRENLDLMHFPYFSVPVFYNHPFVVTIHDLIINHFPTGKASTLPTFFYNLKLMGYKYVISHAVKNAQKIITVSKVTKQEIIDHFKINLDKIIVTYEGVDNKILNSNIEIRNNIQNTKYSPRGEAGKILNTKYFLYVGNAYPHKNLERLVNAFKILVSQYPKIFLVFVGKEDFFYQKLKEKVKRIGLAKQVKLLGEIADDNLLSSLYKNALALVVPSLMEGFGLPALEAMANKCLVLASNIPALREICKDAAVYFDPYSVKDMVGKINEVYSNDTYHYSEKIKIGFERVKLFSWQKMAKETLEAYEQVASNFQAQS